MPPDLVTDDQSTLRRLRQTRRGGIHIVDQGVSSAGNFLLSVLVARAVSSHDFGAFSLAYSGFVLTLNFGRSCGSLPLLIGEVGAAIRAGSDPPHDQQVGAVGAQVSVAIVGSACSLIFSFLSSGVIHSATLGLAIVLPSVLMQDAWRYVFFSQARPANALASDAAMTLTLICGGVLLQVAYHSTHLMSFFYLWLAAGCVGSTVAILQTRAFPNWRLTRRFLSRSRTMIPGLCAEFGAAEGARQGVTYIVAATSSLAAAGAIRGSQVVLGPLGLVAQAFAPLIIVEGRNMRGATNLQLRSYLHRWLLALSLILILLTLPLLFIPRSLGTAVLGSSWSEGRLVLLPMAVAVVAAAATNLCQDGLRILGKINTAFLVRIVIGVPLLIGPLVGDEVHGLSGAAWGFAVGTTCGLVAAYLSLRRGLKYVSAST